MSDKQDLRVREARKAARIVAAEHGIPYQQALDRVARDAGATHWSGFIADPSFTISLAAYRNGALCFEGAPAEGHPVVPFQKMAQGADRVAQSVRRLIEAADRLVTEAEGLSAIGHSPSNALSHAALLVEQAKGLAEPLDVHAKDLLSLYAGRVNADRAIGGTVRHHYRDIQERTAMLERRIAAARAGVPDEALPQNAIDHYLGLRFGRHSGGRFDVLAMAKEDNAPVSMKAAYVLRLYVMMLRSLPSRMDREDGKVMADCMRWTGYALHNLPEIATGAYDANGRWLASECRDFVRMAQTQPVPDYWHPDHPKSYRWMNGSNYWKALCDEIARQAGMPPAYGVAMETFDVSDGLQPFPEPPVPTMGLHKAAAVSRYADEVREWAEWHARGRRVIVQRWQPDAPANNVAADEPYGECVDRTRGKLEIEDGS